MKSMREHTIVCISDTHELHREVDVPDGDILIHAGDFTMFSKSAAAILDFNEWLGELPHRHKIVVPGNHEFFLEADPSKRRLISNATVLIDQSVTVMGLKIWGSPITPLYGGAFGRSSPKDRARLYATIPDDVNILITHGPPYGVLDRSQGMLHNSGCPELREAVKRLKPQLHLFGHVHGANGTRSIGDTVFVNAALLGPGGGIEVTPITLRMPNQTT
jgi:Icc-related predicted phosphoesterase